MTVGLIGRATAQIENSDQLRATLDSTAAAWAADSTIAGVSAGVLHKGDTLLLEGYGRANLEFDVPMPADAVYEVGSITKQFTAAAILQLAAKDSIDLDADITEYLPGYDTRGHTITVRHLLHNTSGLRSYTNLRVFDASLTRQELPRDTLLSLVEAEPLRFAPGMAMSYSNTGFFLLGRIIEKASGQAYADYLQTHLLEPAGMGNSYYCNEQAVVKRRAHGYQWTGDEFRRKAYINHTWPYAGDSLCSTAPDLLAWIRALHHGEILPESLYQEMITPGRLADGTALRYGMGLRIFQKGGRQIIGHGGGIPGFLSLVHYYPETDLIVVGVHSREFTGENSHPGVQASAQRGYAVLRPNPRGSGGYGPSFRAAALDGISRRLPSVGGGASDLTSGTRLPKDPCL